MEAIVTVRYRGAEFALTPASDGMMFGRTGHVDLHISPNLLADWIRRGIMTVKMTTPIDEYDPGEVVSATCDHCHTEHASVPKDRPVCAACGAKGCPSCFSRDMFEAHFDHCDMCDAVLCATCWQVVDGARCCPRDECRQAAREIAEAARATAYAHQKQRHPARRSA